MKIQKMYLVDKSTTKKTKSATAAPRIKRKASRVLVTQASLLIIILVIRERTLGTNTVRSPQ